MIDRLRSGARMAASATVLVGAVAVSGSALGDETINLDYDFYGNGIRVLTLGFDATVSKDGYTARYALRTKGLASIFDDGTTVSIAEGSRDDRRVTVSRFTTDSEDDDKGKRHVEVTWDYRDAPKTIRSYDLGKRKSASLRKVLTPAMPDPLSAMLQMMLSSARSPCESSYTVYDGKHVFELRYAYAGRDRIQAGEGLYSGPAYKCTLTYKPVAGLSRKKMRKARQEPQPPFTIWLAPFESPGLDQPLLIPVHAEGRMKWANLQIQLRKARIADGPLTPTELARN